MSCKPLFAAAIVFALGTVATAQVFDPPPIKGTDIKKDVHRLGLDLGWGSLSSLSLFGIDFDYDSIPTLSASWLWGIQDKIGVGAQLHWADIDFDESLIDDDNGWTFDAVGAYTFMKDPKWGLAGYVTLGLTDESGLHFQIGVTADFKIADQWSAAPYVQYGWGDFSEDSDEEFEIGTFTLGAQVLWQVKPEITGSFGLAWHMEDWDGDMGTSDSDSGSGFSITIGAEYHLK